MCSNDDHCHLREAPMNLKSLLTPSGYRDILWPSESCRSAARLECTQAPHYWTPPGSSVEVANPRADGVIMRPRTVIKGQGKSSCERSTQAVLNPLPWHPTDFTSKCRARFCARWRLTMGGQRARVRDAAAARGTGARPRDERARAADLCYHELRLQRFTARRGPVRAESARKYIFSPRESDRRSVREAHCGPRGRRCRGCGLERTGGAVHGYFCYSRGR